MRLAVIGTGKIVADFLPFAADVPGLTLAAIYGRSDSIDKLRVLAAAYGVSNVHTDYEACLADSTADTVWIALPNALHFDFAYRALMAGKHVICEKPFVLHAEELATLRSVAAQHRLILVEAITNQYLTNTDRMRERLPSLGELRLVQCEFSQYSSRYDAFRRGAVLPSFDPAMGGGALMDLGIYAIHLIVGLLGRPHDVTYVAHIENGIDTSGVALLRYNSATAVCICAKDSAGPSRTKFQGTDGALIMDSTPNEMASFTVQLHGSKPQHVADNSSPHRMVEEFSAFVQMVDNLDLAERDRRLVHSEVVLDVAVSALASAGITLG